MSGTKCSNENIEVFVRCCPLKESDSTLPVPVEIHSRLNKIMVRDVSGEKGSVKTFSFDKVFGPDTSQDVVFEAVAMPLLQEVVRGFNCTILAYGPTGTGKTFTIEGNRSLKHDVLEDPQAGIIPRSMKLLLSMIESQQIKHPKERKEEFEISVSYLELYNEHCFDLLSKSNDEVKLKLFASADPKGSVITQGLEVHKIKSLKEVYDILDKGFKKRKKAATFQNKNSSRSHTVFTVIVRVVENSETMVKTRIGKLHLVDLAGSENVSRSKAVDKQAREAGNINQSLLALGRVIAALGDNATHIPYRESKLTRLLRDSLGGQTKTKIIATISPSIHYYDDTLNTLDYALRAKNITNKPEVNSEVSASALMKDYLDKIWKLKKEIREESKHTDFQVDPESLRQRNLMLEIKSDKLQDEVARNESLLEELNELEETTQKETEELAQKQQEWLDLLKYEEEIAEKLKKEEEEVQLEEMMLTLMEPMFQMKHEEMHSLLKVKEDIVNESKKMKEKLTNSVSERRELREQYTSLSRSRSELHQSLRDLQQVLITKISCIRENAVSSNVEFHHYLSLMESSLVSLQQFREFIPQIDLIVAEFKREEKSFHEKLKSDLHDEEAETLVCLEKIQSDVASADSCCIETLHTIANKCETNSKILFGSINKWKDAFLEELESKKQLLRLYREREIKLLSSLSESCKHFMLEQELKNYGRLVSESLSHTTSNFKQWESEVRKVESFVAELQSFSLQVIDENVEKYNSAHNYFEELVNGEILRAEHLMAYCESSTNSANELKDSLAFSCKDHALERKEILENQIKDAKSSYEELRDHFSKKLNETQMQEEFLCSKTENAIAENKSRRKNLPDVENCLSFGRYLHNEAENIDSLATTQRDELNIVRENHAAIQKPLREIVDRFQEQFSKGLTGAIVCVEESDAKNLLYDNLIEKAIVKASDCDSLKPQAACCFISDSQSMQDMTVFCEGKQYLIENESDCLFCKHGNDAVSDNQTEISSTSKDLRSWTSATSNASSRASSAFKSKAKKKLEWSEVEQLCKDLLDTSVDENKENNGNEMN